jgi:hypothetical protein
MRSCSTTIRYGRASGSRSRRAPSWWAEEGGLVVGGAARWRFGGEVRGGPAGFSGPPRPTALAVAADGALAIGGDRALRVWSVDGAVVELPVGGRVASVAWSRDGRRLAVALLDDPDVGVRWFERDGAALRERPLPGAPGSARHVEFTADGALRALSSGELVVWEVAGPPARHDAPVAEVVSADGAWLCDGAGRRWQRRDRSWTAVGRCVDALGVAADARGARLAVAGRRAVALEEVATGAVTPIALAVEVTAVALAPDGGYLAVGTATGAVEVRRVAGAAVIARLHGHRHPITGVWFTRRCRDHRRRRRCRPPPPPGPARRRARGPRRRRGRPLASLAGPAVRRGWGYWNIETRSLPKPFSTVLSAGRDITRTRLPTLPSMLHTVPIPPSPAGSNARNIPAWLSMAW